MSGGRWRVDPAVGAVHGHISGVHMLHWLSVAVPLAALVAACGVVSLRRACWLSLLGLLLTVATVQLTSVKGEAPTAFFGAPLPLARAPVAADGTLAAMPTPLPTYAIADALFWVSTVVLLGTLVTVLARLGAPRPHRPLPRRVA